MNVITYNLGYLSLDNTQDFFMDGGKNVRPKNATNVTKNLAAVKNFIETQNADIYLFQEVDTNAKRSYKINEYDGLKDEFDGTATFAYMFKSLYIPYPVFNAVGHVESGVMTLNKYNVKEATRISLPSAYSWPKRAVMYKNCLLEQRIDIEDSDKQLVVYNIHLDAYGKEDGKVEQLDILLSNMKEEYEKGNYVIDILLDASGSQSRNQFNVAIQAYIIASALTLVGIPNRVMGYLSFLDYTVLKRYRNYNDNLKSCENIFEYFGAGNNRDGLAIKATCDELIEREEENKILIVLSDGKPNDVKIGNDRSRSLRGESSYKGMVGVKDTALEIRKARKQGVLVLGVFTGKEKDLEAEKIIYGKDFIYTKDIERFSDIVAMYLKKIIKN